MYSYFCNICLQYVDNNTQSAVDDADDDDGTLEMPVSSVDQATQSMSLENKEPGKRIKKSLSFENLEVEFAKTAEKIKQVLSRKGIKAHSLIEQLCTISAVKDQQVPLFDKDIFERVSTIEELWKILRNHWSIYNYEILIRIVEMAECKEATDIFNSFLSTIDHASLKDNELVLQCKPYEGEGLKPILRIKVREKKCTKAIKKKVETLVAKKFDLKEYTLLLRNIKEGCIELVYAISDALASYLLQYKLSGHDMAEFVTLRILHLQIGDMRLLVPSEFGNMVRMYITQSKLLLLLFY